ncbi:MAG: adenosylcobinamide-phosphate synthase CbiB [Lautropia sp.]|nr:adenosylcobinamide-phosphate synthase CbiB [Lautropia sp.]
MSADFPSFLVAVTPPLLALIIDLRFGEPPARWHPVVWMGNYLQNLTPWVAPPVSNASGNSASGGKESTCTPESASEDAFPQDATEKGGGKGQAKTTSQQPVLQADRRWQKHAPGAFLRGALAWLLGALVVTALAWLVQHLILSLPFWIGVPLMALCLKPMLSWRMLRDEVRAVENALSASLGAGRERLKWLVSRDVMTLDEAGVRESAIETLAENLNDSVVAPLFWFALLGLPGAALYRFANTADAMWGYPGERSGRYWQWAGKWAARADDVLNWIPARLTALLLMSGPADPMPAGKIPSARCWRVLCHEAKRTPSPNSGWPMAAMALQIGVSLGKPGVYRLNETAPPPSAAQLPFALHQARRVVWLSAVLLALASAAAGLA